MLLRRIAYWLRASLRGAVSAFPIPYALSWRKRVLGDKDRNGNPVASFADPVSWPVHMYLPGANDLEERPNRDLSMIQWTVYAPLGSAPKEFDKVEIDGVEYVVHGRPEEYSHGPWNTDIGHIIVRLENTEG